MTTGADKPELPASLRDKRQLELDDEFCFGCHPGLSCFTGCCGDVNIVLRPTDILRLARHLGLSTKDFLDKHTIIPITKELHLPVVLLKMGEEPEKRCPLVDEGGCTVYEARPWSCRMYPVLEAIPPARAGVEPTPVHFLAEDDFCKGHSESQTWTVESWRADQQTNDADEIEHGFKKIISHPYFIGGHRQLNPKQMEMFYTGCYDVDNFRRFVFNSTFLERFEVDEDLVDRLRGDDQALLEFGFVWLRFALFGEPTMKVRESAKKEVVPPKGDDAE